MGFGRTGRKSAEQGRLSHQTRSFGKPPEQG
jgi:hypothetical protein